MAVKQYKKSEIVQAIQFTSIDQANIQDIIDFVGLPISIDFTKDGVKLRVIRGAYDVLVASISDYIVMHNDGRLEKVPQAEFDYEEVTE